MLLEKLKYTGLFLLIRKLEHWLILETNFSWESRDIIEFKSYSNIFCECFIFIHFFVFPYTNGLDEYFTEPKREVRNSKLKKFYCINLEV